MIAGDWPVSLRGGQPERSTERQRYCAALHGLRLRIRELQPLRALTPAMTRRAAAQLPFWCDTGKSLDKPSRQSQLVAADRSVCQLARDVEVSGVPGSLLDKVAEHPPERWRHTVAVATERAPSRRAGRQSSQSVPGVGSLAAIEASDELGALGVLYSPFSVGMTGPREVDELAEEDVACPESLGAPKMLDQAERGPARRHCAGPQAILCQPADLAKRHVLKEVEITEQQRNGLG